MLPRAFENIRLHVRRLYLSKGLLENTALRRSPRQHWQLAVVQVSPEPCPPSLTAVSQLAMATHIPEQKKKGKGTAKNRQHFYWRGQACSCAFQRWIDGGKFLQAAKSPLYANFALSFCEGHSCRNLGSRIFLFKTSSPALSFLIGARTSRRRLN